MLKIKTTGPNNFSKIPSSCGIYFFLNHKGEVLYVGKATSLRSRVQSYFGGGILEKRGPLIEKLVEKTKKITWSQTDSVLEALFLEAQKIKKHQPPYNVREKSQKSFCFLLITDEDFPKILIKREREILKKKVKEKVKYSFGPFSSRPTLLEALYIIRRIFPFYSKERSYAARSPLYRQIGLSPEGMSKKEYKKNISHIRLFFEGRKDVLLKKLTAKMKAFSKKKDFERAGEIKKKIYALKYIRDSSLLKKEEREGGESFRIEGYDVSHLSGSFLVGAMVVFSQGEIQKSLYRKFQIKSFSGVDDTRALGEILERRVRHPEWGQADLWVVDGGVAQKRVAEKVLRENNLKGKVVSCQKGPGHKVRKILGEKNLIQKNQDAILLVNSEAHRFVLSYHRQKRDKI